jgi:PPM family protein phosphatase
MGYFGRTDIGRERSTNEDAFLILEFPPFYFFGVADGMGGHAAGEVASSLAFLSVRSFLKENLAGLQDMEPSSDNFFTFIANMMSEANYQIWQDAQKNLGQHGMGTTLTLLLLHANHYYIGHVGDSRAYRVRGEEILQLTRDHSLVGEMVENGSLAVDEAIHHPQRNVLTRALGTNTDVSTDFYHGIFQEGDIFILCTDGLTSFVTDEEIRDVCQDGSGAMEIADTLIGMANTKGGLDNITVVVIKDLRPQHNK